MGENRWPGRFRRWLGRRIRFVKILILFIFVGALLVAGLTGFMVYQATQPVDPHDSRETEFRVPSGASTAFIAENLEEEGFIRNALVFQGYLRIKELDKHIKAGDYQLSPSMELQEIAGKLASGEVTRENVWFTIPEGWDVEMIAGRLEEMNLAEKENFLEKARTPGDNLEEEFSFLTEIPSDAKYALEGYLVPDTYEVESGITERELISLMLRPMESILDEKHLDRLEEIDMNVHQLLTLASIVEREARAAEEREKIASVFHNRLEINQALESCATVQYAIGERKETLLNKHLEEEHHYNTYVYPGLPPGPIASPGESSILAALYPEDTDYRYFVAREDGTGRHYFSETFSQHQRYIRKAREEQ